MPTLPPISHRARLMAPLAGALALLGREVRPAAAQDPAALLNSAAQAMAALSTFHFELNSINGKTELVEGIELETVSGDVERPLSFEATATVHFAIASIDITIISVNGHTWVTDPFSRDGGYTDLGVPDFGQLDPTLLINPDRLMLPALKTVQNPTVVGTESVNGVDTTRIDGTVGIAQALAQFASPVPDATAEAGMTLPESMPFSAWIDAQSMVQRVELTGAVLPTDEPQIVRRVDFSAFNTPVDIQPPTQ